MISVLFPSTEQLAHLETQLATAKLAVAAAAALPPPPPPAIDPAEVAALRGELASVRESLRRSEEQRMQEIRMIQEVRQVGERWQCSDLRCSHSD